MKRFIIGFGWLVAACVAVAGTGTSNEFRVDTRTGVRMAAATEKIQYSTAWATNLTAAQQGESKAVVKVNPCLKTPPKYLVVDMSGGRSAARWPISYLDEVPSGGWTDEYKTEKLVLRYIPAGSFIMGGRATDYPGASNTNLHMVTLTKPFYIGVFECTQRQWELAMGTRPSAFSNETCYATRPVEQVSYVDIRGGVKGLLWPQSSEVDGDSFMGVLRSKVGMKCFDLPTESQWEYACRAGTTTALNNGTNLSSNPEAVESIVIGRGGLNSGWVGSGTTKSAQFVNDHANDGVEVGTSSVGRYLANGFDLWDMHGNVFEQCLNDKGGGEAVLKGGSWINSGWGLASGYEERIACDDVQTRANFSCIGFRICLHDANLPLPDSSTILVNASGADAADWMPTQAGTYQLTHEVQVDGTTVAPMESALFKVEGPVLNIRPLGELTNGVEVAIEGAGDWPVYYTTDGSTPTQESAHYTGPFALPESATVKAVAISAGGVSSEVASKELALHPALAVEDTKARQRYPWNGKVDIDCEITGDATKKYAVTFSVEDEIGHTNLPIRTVTPADRVLPPGKYRFVWDAAADLPKGARFGGVSVSIDAEPSPMADWKRVVTISTDGYAGSETLTDVPVLVRLSSSIEGFDYADFAAPDTGADMIFTDMEGTARYPYEIDEWHRGGESLVWVKLPELRKGTKFKLAYGNAQYAIEQSNNPNNRTIATHSVWREYAGVWHMNEDSGTAFDSTEHGLDALPSCGTNKLADVSQMVAYENGACGRARVNSVDSLQCGNFMMVPSYDALQLGDSFVATGWFNINDINGWQCFFVRKENRERLPNGWDGPGGWGVQLRNSATSIYVLGSSREKLAALTIPDVQEGWVNFAFAYESDYVSCYTNGCLVAKSETVKVWDNGELLGIGGWPSGLEGYSLNGQYDEIRLRGGSLSADRIKADYDMIANRDFCTYGKVEAGPGAEPVPPSTTYRVRFNANGGTGTMADEVFEIGVAKALTANAFTRDGYAFEGWATSAGGAKVYEDQQSVSDLTTPGAMVNLYAVWEELGGVQLWENGPYWAECNVGATKPEESGYYFWWGDTVGYSANTNSATKWGSTEWRNVKWVSSENVQMSSSPFESSSCLTCDKDLSQLLSDGYIDSTGNLVAAHDAATAHLGAPWRMPTDSEILALESNCDTEWTTRNGVDGLYVTGRGSYSSKGIFLPATGDGEGSCIYVFGERGDYWSSTPYSDRSDSAWGLYLYHSGGFSEWNLRFRGQSVRPVRDAAQ